MIVLVTHPTHPRGRATISWTARVIGLTASLMWVTMLGAHLFEEGFQPLEAEGIILGAFIVIAVIGVATAFFNEDTGGSITLVAGVALTIFAVVTAGRNHWLAVMVSGAPFMAAGILFLVSARMQRGSSAV